MSLSLESSLEFFNLKTLKDQSEESLHKIYKHLALKYHPDKGGKAEDFIKLRQAFVVLKQSLNNPAGTTKGSNYSAKANYHYDYQSTAKTENDHLRNKIETQNQKINELTSRLNNYERAYEKILSGNSKYEDVFNLQIQVISFTQEQINNLVDEYNLKREKIQYYYDTKIGDLKKRENPGFWRTMIGTKMEYSEYIEFHNQLIEEHNSKVAEIDNNFSDAILKIYKQSFERLMNLLEF